MKRIALLGFVILVLPVLWVSCNPCGRGYKGGSDRDWTWSNLQLDGMKSFQGALLTKGDTITTDSVFFRCLLTSKTLALNQNSESYGYSVFACPDPLTSQRNPIKTVVFGVGSQSSIDTSIASSITLNYFNRRYKWDKDQKEFLDDLSREYSESYNRIYGQFLSPHNSKPVQIIMLAIRENGDTLKANSEEIVLK